MIFLPPREHGPPHVHVRKSTGEAVITLATTDGPQTIRSVFGMRTTDVVAAFRIVEDHTEYLLQRWREHHG